MQSISVPSIHLLPVLNPADTSCDGQINMAPSDSEVVSLAPAGDQAVSVVPDQHDFSVTSGDDLEASASEVKGNFDVPKVEELLNRLFNEELEKALADEAAVTLPVDAAVAEVSNLIEFPMVQELMALHRESELQVNTIDFTPSDAVANDPVLETDLTRFTPSIIDRDDDDYLQLQVVINAQREQLAALRAELKQKDAAIRAQAIDLASKDDQLKYVPELFNKAIRLAQVEAYNLIMSKDLEVEKLVNEELNAELIKARQALAALDNHKLVKFGRALGFIN